MFRRVSLGKDTKKGQLITTHNILSVTSPANNADQQVTTILWLLIVAAVIAVITKYIRLPYTIVLVVGGVIIALVPGIPQVPLTPDLIVIVFLPVLLFEASYHLSFEHLRTNFRFISNLAIWGVLATAAIIGGLLSWWGGLPWQSAFLFGAIVAATDPVSVVATFRKLGTSGRLTTIIESESLFNDGSALVLFNLLLGIILTNQFDFWSSAGEFVKVALGGLVLGATIGYLALLLLTQLDDYLTEMLVTIIVAYGSFLLAEQLTLSPALTVVVAGLIVGNFGRRKALSATSQIALGYSWEMLGFIANSLIFLLVGLQIRTLDLSNFGWITLLAIGVTLLSRFVVVIVFSWFTNIIDPDVVIPWDWQAMLIWGGLRGALSLAMALSIPLVLTNGQEFPDRNKILVMTVGVIMFTLLVQGLTIEPLLKALRKRTGPDKLQQYETLQTELLRIKAKRQEVQTMLEQNLITPTAAQQLIDEYNEKEKSCLYSLNKLPFSKRFGQQDQAAADQRNILQQEKDRLNKLYVTGLIDEETLHRLRAELEAESLLLEEYSGSEPVGEETIEETINEAKEEHPNKLPENPPPA